MFIMSYKLTFSSIIPVASLCSILLLYAFKNELNDFIWDLRRRYFLKRKKVVHVISEKSQWERISSEIISHSQKVGSVGFDCEWIQIQGERFPVALLQLASHSGLCVLVRLNLLKNDIPPTLKILLEDETILKVGVSPDTDSQYLFLDYDIRVKQWLDLRHLAVQDIGVDQCKNIRLGLDGLADIYLGWKMNKNYQIRMGNWEAPTLTQSQVDYAAEDALAGIHILIKLIHNLRQKSQQSLPFILSSASWMNVTRDAIKKIANPFSEMKFSQKTVANGSNLNKITGRSNGKSPSRLAKDLNMSYSVRKTPLYHNSQLWAPDGEPLCTCDPKKAIWYVKKGLGEYVTKSPLVVRLKFEPAGRPFNEGSDGKFYLQERSNECVVCGRGESYIRKSVIPHEYRRYFPQVLKTHQSHDIVLMCAQCHQRSNIRDISLRQALAEEFNAPIGTETDVKVHEDFRLKGVKKAGHALLKFGDALPLGKKEILENTLKEFFEIEDITEEHLRQASKLDVQILNTEYEPHGYKVFQNYEKIGLIQLEQRWRQWFLDSMKPEFLPENWSISHNHEKLRMKMQRSPIGSKSYEEFKVALFGTEGKVDITHQTEAKTVTTCPNNCPCDNSIDAQ